MEILAPGKGLIERAIRQALEATNIAVPNTEVPKGYMANQASIDEVLKQITIAIKVIQAHPAPGALIVKESTRSGSSHKSYLAISASADSQRYTELSPFEDPTTKGSPISQLLNNLSSLKKDVLALPSKRPLTPEEEAKISEMGL
jgi:hypothetical protein